MKAQFVIQLFDISDNQYDTAPIPIPESVFADARDKAEREGVDVGQVILSILLDGISDSSGFFKLGPSAIDGEQNKPDGWFIAIPSRRIASISVKVLS